MNDSEGARWVSHGPMVHTFDSLEHVMRCFWSEENIELAAVTPRRQYQSHEMLVRNFSCDISSGEI